MTGPRPAPSTRSGTEAEAGADPSEVNRAGRRTLALLAVAALALIVLPLALSRLVEQPAGQEHRFDIPRGTADRVLAGEPVEVLPADLSFRLRDRLVVVNHDDRPHQVGPFTVAPGERLDRRFSEALSFSGYCSLHPGGNLQIEVGSPD